MTRRSSAADWTTVDRTPDPSAYVGYLDTVAGHDAIRHFKRLTYELLALRPGDRALDAGCGTGEDARELARLVAPGGLAVGVDVSATMIDEARRRAAGSALPVELVTGDVGHLDFPDESFNGTRAERLFQHLAAPERGLNEMIRVTVRGGRIVVADTDWGSLLLDAPDQEPTAALLAEIAGAIRNPWMGRRLYALFRRAGLAEVRVTAGTAVITELAQAERMVHLSDGLERALAHGHVSAAAAAKLQTALAEADRAGRFCCALTAFVVVGRRP